MGLFKKRATDPAEMERLRSEIEAMASRLDAADAHKAELGHQVQHLVTRLETPLTAPPSEPAPVPLQRGDLDELRDRMEQIANRVAEVDARVTAISTELANQLNEISGELDGISSDGSPPEQFVDELRDAQTRLANEQARYQIAFRQDLADLADRLRKS